MPPKKSRVPQGRPLRDEDLSPENRKAAREIWADQGNMKTKLNETISAASKSVRAHPNAVAAQKRRAETAQTLLDSGKIKDKPITMSGAVAHRVKLLHESTAAARSEGNSAPPGTAWYWEHAKAIEDAGKQYGFDRETAIRATTPLSAQNPPETERKTGAALMDIVANQDRHTVELPADLHAAVSAKSKTLGGAALPESMKGKVVTASNLSAQQLSALAAVSVDHEKKGKTVNTTMDLSAIRGARAPVPVANSIEYLRGERSAESLVDPLSAPKVASYTANTLEAHHDNPEYHEYYTRVHHLTHGDPNQGVMDLWGLRHSNEGMLSADRDTAEDSWMQAINTRQPLESIGRTSPAKFAASDPQIADPGKATKTSPVTGETAHPSGQVSAAAVIHSQSNKATRLAAARVPVQMGDETTHLPAPVMQELPWMRARIIAGKAPELNPPKAAKSAKAKPGGSSVIKGLEVGQLFNDKRYKKK